MASAVLASRNESNWAQSRGGGGGGGGGGFMGKFHSSNPNPNNSKRKTHAPAGDINDLSPAVTQSASDDASSFNQRSIVEFNRGRYVTFNIGSYSRKDLVQLKNRLVSELEKIQNLSNRIESGDLQLRSGGDRTANKQQRPNNKKIAGNKRPPPFDSGRGPKRSAAENASLMKLCGQTLTKLMKHKHSWVFNSPVDVVGMGLHDYHQIIKRPMDLGTVKSKIAKNLYDSPLDFAADVRLTFDNALLYNPKGHDVHVMAEQLLARFEDLFKPVYNKLEEDERDQERIIVGGGRGGVSAIAGTSGGEELQGSSWNHIPTPERLKKPSPRPVAKKPERMQVPIPATGSSNPPSVQSVPTPSPMRAPPVKPLATRPSSGKQPKPKAKDPNKREMSLEEKHKLGLGLQSLPQEKMDQVVQIISKKNGHLTQDGDEIELDIEAVDTETLWELDRLVTNWKKMVSKIKRQALMVNNNTAGTEVNRVKLCFTVAVYMLDILELDFLLLVATIICKMANDFNNDGSLL